MKCLSNRILLTSLLSLFALCGLQSAARAQGVTDDCTFVLDQNNIIQPCTAPSSGIAIQSWVGSELVLRVDLEPQPTHLSANSVRFDICFDGNISGWTFNIGDSASNNGWGGDAATQSNDAEIQLGPIANQFVAYGDDDSGGAILHVEDDFAVDCSCTTVIVQDETVSWFHHFDTTDGLLNMPPFLFALNGQADFEGPVNHTIYAAFNRTISDPTRNGTGVSTVRVTTFAN